jgi:RNA polymerase sigma-70 factor (ECF subfamily)
MHAPIDEEAMRGLYAQHSKRLYAMALRLTGSRADAEDVLQETFLRAWRSSDSFRGEASAGTWLCRIAINASRDIARRRSRVTDEAEAEAEAGADGVRADGAARELEAALARLSEGYREVLVMHDVLGMNHGEIALVLQVDVGTSKSQLHKARARMREMLRPESEERGRA